MANRKFILKKCQVFNVKFSMVIPTPTTNFSISMKFLSSFQMNPPHLCVWRWLIQNFCFYDLSSTMKLFLRPIIQKVNISRTQRQLLSSPSITLELLLSEERELYESLLSSEFYLRALPSAHVNLTLKLQKSPISNKNCIFSNMCSPPTMNFSIETQIP